MPRKRDGGRRNFGAVMRRDRGICLYCGDEASCVDHIVPYSLTRDNGMGNLASACTICNGLAWSYCFDSFEEKREYILEKRRIRARPIEWPAIEAVLEPMAEPEPAVEIQPTRPEDYN